MGWEGHNNFEDQKGSQRGQYTGLHREKAVQGLCRHASRASLAMQYCGCDENFQFYSKMSVRNWRGLGSDKEMTQYSYFKTHPVLFQGWSLNGGLELERTTCTQEAPGMKTPRLTGQEDIREMDDEGEESDKSHIFPVLWFFSGNTVSRMQTEDGRWLGSSPAGAVPTRWNGMKSTRKTMGIYKMTDHELLLRKKQREPTESEKDFFILPGKDCYYGHTWAIDSNGFGCWN